MSDAEPTSNQKIILRSWEKLKYHDPALVLKGLREIENYMADKLIDEKVSSLRTRKLKTHLEGRQAALFCYGIGNMIGKKVFFSRSECSDYDIVSMFKDGSELKFSPVQLKEIVPKILNPNTNIDDVISELKKYRDSDDLIVAIHLNQRTTEDLEKIQIPKLNISQLWVYGSLSSDQSKWFIYGDLLNKPQFHEFMYP